MVKATELGGAEAYQHACADYSSKALIAGIGQRLGLTQDGTPWGLHGKLEAIAKGGKTKLIKYEGTNLLDFEDEIEAIRKSFEEERQRQRDYKFNNFVNEEINRVLSIISEIRSQPNGNKQTEKINYGALAIGLDGGNEDIDNDEEDFGRED